MRDPHSNIEHVIDLGFVGEPEQVNPRIVEVIAGGDLIPVVAPIGVSRDGVTYNINADTFASALASAMKAKRLLLLTDVAGRAGQDMAQLIPKLTVSEARTLITDGTITGGMIPKVEGLHRRRRGWRRGRGDHQRQGPTCGVDRAVHKARGGDADRAGLRIN